MYLMSTHCKADFPLFETYPDLVYLDNAATSQKPRQVIEAISHYYLTANANVHRGVHRLSDGSTERFEQSRRVVADFFGAKNSELIIVRNTTEATNGLAYGWGDHQLTNGDVIITSNLEHHSSLVVWQQLAQRRGARLQVISVTDHGELDIQELERALATSGKKTKLVALTYVSNTLGSVIPVERIGQMVQNHAPQARFYLDCAQAAPHLPLNFAQLQKAEVDFLAVSAHKMLGPMGIGGLLVREELLKSGEMQPWLFGGGMINEVTTQTATFAEDVIDRFTAGTPDVASLVGWAAACQYLAEFGMKKAAEHDRELVRYAYDQLSKIPEVELVGPNPHHQDRVGSVAFLYQGVHAHDVAQVLDSQGVAVRSGQHCTMPLHSSQGWTATVRASFQVYTSKEDIDKLISALEKVAKVFTHG